MYGCSILEAESNSQIVSLVMDGGSSMHLPHFTSPPKSTSGKDLLEVAPYVCLNNGAKTSAFYYHFGDYSQDPNFVLSILWQEIRKLYEADATKKHTLYLQVCFYLLDYFFYAIPFV